MEGANFFQSKIVLSKAFPKKKMTMSRLHQLYRDIYMLKPKSKLLNPMNLKDHEKLPGFHGGLSIYNEEQTEKMINFCIDNDNESQFRTNDIIQMVRDQRTSKDELLTQVSKEEYEEAGDAQDSVIYHSPYKRDDSSPIRQAHFFAPLEKRGIRSLQTSTNKFQQKPKWPSYINELKESISKHTLRSSKAGGSKHVNVSQREINRSTRESFSEINSHVKFHLHRIGLNCHRSAIEDADSIARSFAKESVEKNIQMSPQQTSKKSLRMKKPLKLLSTDYTTMGVGVGLRREKESLPRLRSTKFSESHIPNPIMKEDARVGDRLHQLFDSCNKVQKKIGQIDRKLEKGGRAAVRNYSNLDMKLQRVMKANFLPQNMMLDDTL